MSTVTKLPFEQQQKRQRLVDEAAANGSDPLNAPPAPNTPTPAEPSVPRPQAQEPQAPQAPEPQAPEPRQPEPQPRADTVSVSREELDALRADAERTQAMERRLQTLELELAESRVGLTGAPLPPSGSAVAEPSAPSPAPSAPAGVDWRPLSTDGLDLTPDEANDYSESEPIIAKLAKREAAKQINAAVEPLVQRIANLERNIQQTTGRIDRTNEQAFVSEVRKNVPEFDAIVGHKHWRAFLQSQNPHSSYSFGEELNKAHTDRNLEGTKRVFKAFSEKYLHDPAKAAAYAGVDTTAASSSVPATPTSPETLKMSERRKASDDFIKGKITKAELQVVVDKFKKAEAEGRIDYNS